MGYKTAYRDKTTYLLDVARDRRRQIPAIERREKCSKMSHQAAIPGLSLMSHSDTIRSRGGHRRSQPPIAAE
jgi:hypothetical protein